MTLMLSPGAASKSVASSTVVDCSGYSELPKDNTSSDGMSAWFKTTAKEAFAGASVSGHAQ